MVLSFPQDSRVLTSICHASRECLCNNSQPSAFHRDILHASTRVVHDHAGAIRVLGYRSAMRRLPAEGSARAGSGVDPALHRRARRDETPGFAHSSPSDWAEIPVPDGKDFPTSHAKEAGRKAQKPGEIRRAVPYLSPKAARTSGRRSLSIHPTIHHRQPCIRPASRGRAVPSLAMPPDCACIIRRGGDEILSL